MRKFAVLVQATAAFFLVVPSTWADTSDRIVIAANADTATHMTSFNPLDMTFTQAQEAAGLTNPFSFFVGVRSGAHCATFDTAVELLDPSGAVSDIVDFHLAADPTVCVQSITLNFFSDVDGGPAPVPPAGAFVVTTPETGGLQDISSLFLNSHGVQASDVPALIEIQSDVEATPVPEPTSVFLFGSGLSGLGLWFRRRRTLL